LLDTTPRFDGAFFHQLFQRKKFKISVILIATPRKCVVDRKRRSEMQKQRQAECEREAIRLNQDVSKCKIEALPQENRDNPNRDKNGK